MLVGKVPNELKVVKGEENVDEMKARQKILYKCPYCDMESNSSPGLKGHITKMHGKEVKENLRKLEIKNNESTEIIDSLLKEVLIEITDDENENKPEECTLEETIVETAKDKNKEISQ